MTPPLALQLDPEDTVAVALENLPAQASIELDGQLFTTSDPIPAKHKFALRAFAVRDPIRMYGVTVARARLPIALGGLLTTANVLHDAEDFHSAQSAPYRWSPPDVARFEGRTFAGYHRDDGQVGTRNYWLVIPLVFCENRNVEALREAFEEELGYARSKAWREQVRQLVGSIHHGQHPHAPALESTTHRIFPNLDGIRFLTHQGGCGGTRDDARALCGLLAGYIHHPNVAGATVLSLGCQHAQPAMLLEELQKRDPASTKPVLIFSQQECGTESALLSRAIDQTFAALVTANRIEREPAPLSALTVGLKCGGSDGFSGISANPAIGQLSDLIVALGGRTILSEFPELCGVEQNLIDRCESPESAQRFVALMRAYQARARAVNSGFEMNPSPGNIRDGLLTDAIKSAGAARKAGTAPVADVLDYPEYATTRGLTLLCTPGNDVEAVTGQVGAGANLVLFTTGLGTPTGNPIAPVLKLSTNRALADRMPDIIDLDTSPVLRGEATLAEMGERILDLVLETASGKRLTHAETLRQDDFIPWKRGVSL